MNISFLKSSDDVSVPESSLSDKLPNRTCTSIVSLSKTDASAVDKDNVAIREPASVMVTGESVRITLLSCRVQNPHLQHWQALQRDEVYQSVVPTTILVPAQQQPWCFRRR